MLAKKHKTVASATQIELGGSKHPLPRQLMEIVAACEKAMRTMHGSDIQPSAHGVES